MSEERTLGQIVYDAATKPGVTESELRDIQVRVDNVLGTAHALINGQSKRINTLEQGLRDILVAWDSRGEIDIFDSATFMSNVAKMLLGETNDHE